MPAMPSAHLADHARRCPAGSLIGQSQVHGNPPAIGGHQKWSYTAIASFVEGINNKCKVLKRMAYGFRNDAQFFLQIRAAFPGVP